MAAAEHFDPVETAILAAFRSSGEISDHAGNVVLVHFARDRAVQRFPHDRRRNCRQLCALPPFAAPAQVGDLAHDCRALGMNTGGECREVWDDFIHADIQLPKDGRAIDGDVR